MTRFAVTGARDFTNWKVLFDTLNESGILRYDLTLKVGDAKTGADFFTYQWAYANCMDEDLFIRFKADWEKFGRAAGPIRNKAMIDSGVDKLFAFPTDNSIGTINCCEYAKGKGISVYFPEAVKWNLSDTQPKWFEWAKELTGDLFRMP